MFGLSAYYAVGSIALMLTVFTATSVSAQTASAKKFYKHEVIAASTATTSLFPSPSINDAGVVAFAGREAGGTVFVSTGEGTATYRKILSGTNPNTFVAGNVQINNSNQIVLQTFVSGTNPPQNYLYRADGNALDSFTVLAAANGSGSFNDFDQIYPSATINNQNLVAFATRRGNTSTILTTGERPNFYQSVMPSSGDALRPMLSDDGCIVVRAGGASSDPLRLYNYELSGFSTIADAHKGFTTIGQSPSISGACEVIVFYGVLSEAGAQELGTNAGAGIFASVDLSNGYRRIFRLTGRLIEDNAAQGGNDDGICDVTETCKQGELGFDSAGNPLFFNAYNANARVAVAHQSLGAAGIEDDSFVVSFIATPNAASDVASRPFTTQSGLWTLQATIKTNEYGLNIKPSAAIPVVQIGDPIDGKTVTNISVYDQLANVGTNPPTQSPGDHRLAFHVSTNAGINLIIRAKRLVDSPLIFIPGIGGSLLDEQTATGKKNLWFGNFSPSNYSRLSLAPEHPITPIIASDAMRDAELAGVKVKPVYSILLDTLIQRGGFTEYKVNGDEQRRTSLGCDLSQKSNKPNLFVFAYDWRKSNTDNAALLADYVRCVQQFYPDTKVNIVAHSMGGLLARRFVLDHNGGSKVAKLITIGSPWLGSPKAIYTMETGNFFGDTESKFSIDVVTRRTLKSVVESFKGVHELLPSKPYIDLGGTPFVETNDVNGNGLSSEVYSYDQLYTFINGRFTRNEQRPYITNGYFHVREGQDDWRGDMSGVEYFVLYGEQPRARTIGQVVASSKGRPTSTRKPERLNIKTKGVDGDGTVPTISATRRHNGIDLAPNVEVTPFYSESKNTDKFIEHTGLTQNPDVHEKLFSLLGIPHQSAQATNQSQGVNAMSTTKDVTANAQVKPSKRESHYVEIDGVERVSIADSERNRTEPIAGTTAETVPPDVDYSGGYDIDGVINHDIILPTDTEYTIEFRVGTEYIDIEVVKGLDNINPNFAMRYSDLQLPAGVTAQLKLHASGADDLRYDADGDGIFETLVPPNSKVSGAAAQDTTPPKVAVSSRLLRSGTREVSVVATDSEAGVKTIYYALNNDSFQIYTAPLMIASTGSVTIHAFADDNVGNRSGVVTHFIKAR